MTDYLWQYISHYTVIVKLLQTRKTALNQFCLSIEDNAHKSFTDRIMIELLTLSELDTFHYLQTIFLRSTNLTHYNLKHQLYIDMNAFKEFSFSTHIYHTKNTHESSISEQKSMKFILFLSKTLSDAETHYWLTELEVADLVWVIQKICHMIEFSEMSTIVYTDHFTTLSIVKQFSLTAIISIDRMNLQLVHASEFLQCFQLDIHHKKDKMNIISDTLFWLASQFYCSQVSVNNLSLNALVIETPIYVTSLVKMSNTFCQCLINAYQTESQWTHIQTMIENNKALSENTVNLLYWLTKDLIYFNNVEWEAYLCISYSLIKEVFQLAHNELDYADYAHTHKCLSQDLYIYNMTTYLHEYIWACSKCQLN